MSLSQRLAPRRPRGADPGVRVAVHVAAERLLAAVAHIRPGMKPQFSPAPSFDGPEAAQAWVAWQRRHQPRSHTSLLLNSEHYRILPLDAPRVPPEERKAAVRYQAQELLDFPTDEASIDCLDVPPAAPGQPVSRVFVVAGLKSEIGRWMVRYRDARLDLDVIDIPELALRNLSVLAAGDRAHIYLHIGLRSSRLVIVWQRELCAFRQFDLSGRKLAAASDEEVESTVEHLTLDIQRTADAFARQFHGADLATLWVSSVARLDALVSALGALQSLPVQALRIEDLVDWQGPGSVCDCAAGIDHTLAIGAALRGAV
jgi:MSHA biogenesis protein MshI